MKVYLVKHFDAVHWQEVVDGIYSSYDSAELSILDHVVHVYDPYGRDQDQITVDGFEITEWTLDA
jgi:hypothetical protein